MKHIGEYKKLKKSDGRYFVDIDITVDEWKEMIMNNEIFYPEAKKMIIYWYLEEDHQATSKTIMTKYNSNLKGTPYNGIVIGLATKILKYLGNRFWVEDSNNQGKESFWCIPFEGWHLEFDENKNFVWKLRENLVIAIDETPNFTKEIIDDIEINQKLNNDKMLIDDTLETYVLTKEGKKLHVIQLYMKEKVKIVMLQ